MQEKKLWNARVIAHSIAFDSSGYYRPLVCMAYVEASQREARDGDCKT